MIDPALAFLYFGLPTMVGLIGLAAMKLHERSAPTEAGVTASAEHDSEIPKKGWGFIGGGPTTISEVTRVIPSGSPARRDAPVPSRPVSSDQD